MLKVWVDRQIRVGEIWFCKALCSRVGYISCFIYYFVKTNANGMWEGTWNCPENRAKTKIETRNQTITKQKTSSKTEQNKAKQKKNKNKTKQKKNKEEVIYTVHTH